MKFETKNNNKKKNKLRQQTIEFSCLYIGLRLQSYTVKDSAGGFDTVVQPL